MNLIRLIKFHLGKSNECPICGEILIQNGFDEFARYHCGHCMWGVGDDNPKR